SVLRGGGLTLPGTIHVPSPAHVHANWIFTAPGHYTFRVQGFADGQRTRTATYTFAVGTTAASEAARGTRLAGGRTVGTQSGALTSLFGGTADLTSLSREAKTGAGVPLDKTPVRGVCLAAGNPAALPGSLATAGHFDLGPQIVNGALVAAVRDDRQQPAQWRRPSEIAFGLSEKAAIPTPKELSFLAKPGTPMWMISSVQQAGVPWLGESSQHESIISGTTGEVATTITKIQGPGQVAHFLPTALGAGVGKMLFSTAGGPSSYVIPANTHMHGVWAFTAPGEYRISYQHQVTTKDGKKLTADGVLTVVAGSCDPASTAVTAHQSADPLPAQAGLGAHSERNLDLAWWIQTALLAAVLLTNVVILVRWSRRRAASAAVASAAASTHTVQH
ncbi:MAG: TIGR03773 family transporter-associated surface protein, partial [Arcanobacterium sp.]|nr:TIGR03773 family transporter-associated surface protein [Arcanobacterium sp.]